MLDTGRGSFDYLFNRIRAAAQQPTPAAEEGLVMGAAAAVYLPSLVTHCTADVDMPNKLPAALTGPDMGSPRVPATA